MENGDVYSALIQEYEKQLRSIISQGLLLLQLKGSDLNDEEEDRLLGYDGFIQPDTWRELPNLGMIRYMQERLAYLRDVARDARNVNDASGVCYANKQSRMDTEHG